MHTLLADGWHGPGPWIPLVPVVWAAAVAGVSTFLRRTAERARRDPAGGGPAARAE